MKNPEKCACKKTKNLTSDEICGIIKICHESGVAKFSFGGLVITFGDNEKYEINEYSPILTKNDSTGKVESESFLQDEINIRESQLAMMDVTDPIQYEKLIEQGELTNGRKEEKE